MSPTAQIARLAGLTAGLWLLCLFVPALATGQAELFVRDVAGENTREFTVRVTSLRQSPTVSVRVDFPPNVRPSGFPGPPTNWGLQEITPDDGSERITGMFVRGGEIERGEYTDFQVIARVGGPGGIWRVEQTYKDRVTEVWEGGATLATTQGTPPGLEPAAEPPPPAGEPVSEPVAAETGSGRNGFLFWLGIFLLAAAVTALVVAAYVWSTQPGRSGLDEPAA